MDATAAHHFRSRKSRFYLSQHNATRNSTLLYMLQRLDYVLRELKEEGEVLECRVYPPRSYMTTYRGCNCRVVVRVGNRQPALLFGVAISARALVVRQAEYPGTPQLLLRTAKREVLRQEVLALIRVMKAVWKKKRMAV